MKIFLSVLIVLLSLLSLWTQVDSQAMDIQDEAFKRAMITFGVAKSLNAIISLIQGTELSLTPAGLGLTLSVGEILDPLNDMVERFSWIMLFASVSLGVQKLLLIVSSKILLQAILIFSAISTLFVLWYKQLHTTKVFSYTLKTFVVLLVLRFGAVVFIYLSQFTYNSILATQYNDSMEIVQTTQAQLEAYQNQSEVNIKEEESFFSSLKKSYDRSIESLNVSKQIENLEKSSDKAFNNIVTLITIFVVQSILFPLLYIWLMIIFIKIVMRNELKFPTLKTLYNQTT